MSPARQPPSLSREVVVFLTTAMLLLMVVAAFNLYLYRDAIGEMRQQRLDEAREAAADLAAELAGGPLPSSDRLLGLAPRARGVRIRAADGSVLLQAGEPIAIDLDELIGTERPETTVALEPTTTGAPVIAALAPFGQGGRRLSVQLDLPADQLAVYLRTQRRILFLNVGIVGALTLLVLLYLRRLLAPYESMLARARQIESNQLGARRGEAGEDEAEDETEFLISTFERALAALDERNLAPADDIAVLERTLAPSLESGFLLLDDAGRVLSINRLGAELLGVREPQPGTELATVLVGHPELLEVLGRAVAERAPIQREEVDIEAGEPAGADGPRRRVLGLSAHPLRRDDGELRGFIVLFADLTDMRRQARRDEMSRSLTQLGEIAAGVAHEMRNGLGTLKGYLTLIDHARDGDSVHDYLAEMRSESEHLERVLNDFLSFARPGTARSDVVDLAAVVERAIADPALTGTEVTLRNEAGELRIHGDARLLERALRNLLDNAVRAQEEAGVSDPLTVRLRRREEGALIEIEDRGSGIDPSIRDSLLQPFVSGRADGVGLGLALAHRIAELHHGTLEVSDRDEGGVRATLRLPVIIDT